VFGVRWDYFVRVFNGSSLFVVTGRDMNATWRSTSELGLSKAHLLHLLQNGLPYRTWPPGISIDWRDPYVQAHFDVQASQLVKFVPGPGVPPILASAQVTVGIQVTGPLLTLITSRP
jgi:hypothetical protein